MSDRDASSDRAPDADLRQADQKSAPLSLGAPLAVRTPLALGTPLSAPNGGDRAAPLVLRSDSGPATAPLRLDQQTRVAAPGMEEAPAPPPLHPSKPAQTPDAADAAAVIETAFAQELEDALQQTERLAVLSAPDPEMPPDSPPDLNRPPEPADPAAANPWVAVPAPEAEPEVETGSKAEPEAVPEDAPADDDDAPVEVVEHADDALDRATRDVRFEFDAAAPSETDAALVPDPTEPPAAQAAAAVPLPPPQDAPAAVVDADADVADPAEPAPPPEGADAAAPDQTAPTPGDAADAAPTRDVATFAPEIDATALAAKAAALAAEVDAAKDSASAAAAEDPTPAEQDLLPVPEHIAAAVGAALRAQLPEVLDTALDQRIRAIVHAELTSILYAGDKD
ncbi:MAG: hypothetical protein AAGE76_15175 [Pseudomonadota bacterium]